MRVEEISAWVEDARKAFASATDLDSLKVARLAHSGDKSPIALASRALGSLSPEEKASFGKPDRKVSCRWTLYPDYKHLISGIL